MNVPLKKKINAKYLNPAVKKELAQLKAEKETAEKNGDIKTAKQKVAEVRAIAEKVKKDIEFEFRSSPERMLISEEKRKDYTTVGGLMHLDGSYTVFGEVVQGMDVVDKISALKTDPDDRPIQDVKIIDVLILD